MQHLPSKDNIIYKKLLHNGWLSSTNQPQCWTRMPTSVKIQNDGIMEMQVWYSIPLTIWSGIHTGHLVKTMRGSRGTTISSGSTFVCLCYRLWVRVIILAEVGLAVSGIFPEQHILDSQIICHNSGIRCRRHLLVCSVCVVCLVCLRVYVFIK